MYNNENNKESIKSKLVQKIAPYKLFCNLIFVFCFIFILFVLLNKYYIKNVYIQKISNKYSIDSAITINDDALLFFNNKESNIQKYNINNKSLNLIGKTLSPRYGIFIHRLADSSILICGGQDFRDNKFCEIYSDNKKSLKKSFAVDLPSNSIATNMADGNTLIFSNYKNILYEYSATTKNLSVNDKFPKECYENQIIDLISFPNNILFVINKDGKYWWIDFHKNKILYSGNINKKHFSTAANKDTVIISGGSNNASGEYYYIDNEILSCKTDDKKCSSKAKMIRKRANHKSLFINDENVIFVGGEKDHNLFSCTPKNITYEIYNLQTNSTKQAKTVFPYSEFFNLCKITKNKILIAIDKQVYILKFNNIK